MIHSALGGALGMTRIASTVTLSEVSFLLSAKSAMILAKIRRHGHQNVSLEIHNHRNFTLSNRALHRTHHNNVARTSSSSIVQSDRV